MKIVYHKDFNKSYLKLSSKQQDKVDKALELFMENPFDPQLKNHPLHGDQKGRRAIAAGGDLRIVFEEINNYKKVIFYCTGSHNQVY